MKKTINQHFKIMYLVCLLVLTVACSDTEETNSNNIQEATIEKILQDMKKVGDAKGKIVVFEMKNYKGQDYKEHFELIENSTKVLAFATGLKNNSKSPGDNYTVTCTWGDGDTTVTECGESAGCAGQATWDCLENGGCATVCNAKITYTPSITESSVAKNNKPIQQILAILDEVVKTSTANNKGVTFTISRNKDTYKLKELSFIETSQKNNMKSGRTFQVDCYDGEGELLWQESYYDTLSASAGILKCTDEDGGCAEICEIYAAFYP
ncbi:hypothetical protein IMCC3317_18320 [Kordia antarctica]|uniref:Uncharacterized protein n=1 Tax=Kordia antarctica TaxID=1218801 RepID=A0A7L4ZJ86_9FLAO|nr:hypothetical protein [Kordia antarctica]QHI36469.1 hypothetical protein IMCC3317_18320 [Kordia antarctica]